MNKTAGWLGLRSRSIPKSAGEVVGILNRQKHVTLLRYAKGSNRKECSKIAMIKSPVIF